MIYAKQYCCFVAYRFACKKINNQTRQQTTQKFLSVLVMENENYNWVKIYNQWKFTQLHRRSQRGCVGRMGADFLACDLCRCPCGIYSTFTSPPLLFCMLMESNMVKCSHGLWKRLWSTLLPLQTWLLTAHNDKHERLARNSQSHILESAA